MSDVLSAENATALERALEALTTRIDAIEAPIADLWNAEACPENLLPWLAFQLSIDSWKPDWSVQTRRAAIAQAIPLQRIKGSVQSVLDVVGQFGGQAAIREGWQLDPPSPYTFEIVLTVSGAGGEPASAQLIEDVVEEVARTKPARTHFTFAQGLATAASIFTGCWARPALFTRLEMAEA